jgi:gas vesicle protein
LALRFLIGVAIGFGVGFAGAVLFAPERKKGERVEWPAGTVDSGPPAFDTDHNIMASVRRAMRSVQDQINEALEEAKKAQADTEREMRARYERIARRTTEEPPKAEVKKADDKKRTVKEKKPK